MLEVGGWMMEVGSWRLGTGVEQFAKKKHIQQGWRLDIGGWKLELNN